MKTYKSILPAVLLSSFLFFSCNNDKTDSSSTELDSTSTNPTNDAADYHPDQTQEIPRTDSSNIIGTDSIGDSTKNQ